MKKLIAGLVVAAILILLAIATIWFAQINEELVPRYNPNGPVERAYAYCEQFNEADCNTNSFVDTKSFPEPIDCYWHTENNICYAGTGYQ